MYVRFLSVLLPLRCSLAVLSSGLESDDVRARFAALVRADREYHDVILASVKDGKAVINDKTLPLLNVKIVAGAANNVLGYADTVPVTVDELLMLTAAVRRGLKTPLLHHGTLNAVILPAAAPTIPSWFCVPVSHRSGER